ncbi:MAG: glycosyltransferase family 39 protein [Candidatus Ratteibacteria bacterium]|jgi:4-amino-4-deoxy-L-arabinose transferase-like glycosyltransferase
MENPIRKDLLLIFLLSFIVRAGFALFLQNHLYFDDEYHYLQMADNFLAGKGLIVAEHLKAYRPPLYPIFLLFMKRMGLHLIHIRLVQAFIGAFIPVLIAIAGKKFFSKKTGLIAGLICGIYPFFIYYTGFLLTEVCFILLTVIAVLSAINAFEKKAWPHAFIAGIWLGLAGLCRPTMEAFFPFIALYLFFSVKPWQDRIRKIGLLFAGFFLLLSPWVVRNWIHFHKLIPGTTMGGGVFWEGNNPYSEGGPCSYFPEGIYEVPEEQRDAILYKMTFSHLQENPKRALWLLQNKWKRFWNITPNAKEFDKGIYRIVSTLSFGILLPFFLLGFLLTFSNRQLRLIHILIIFFTLFHIIMLASIRYRIPIEPFIILLAVEGFQRLLTMIRTTLKKSSHGTMSLL